MKRLLILTVIAFLISACGQPIVVDGADSTPPTLSLILAKAETLNGHYTDNDEHITALIDPERHFLVDPLNDLQFVFHAADNQSGISRIEVELEATFTCYITVLGLTYERRNLRLVIPSAFLHPTPPGESTNAEEGKLVEVSRPDLFRRACHHWYFPETGATVNPTYGRLSDIQINYLGKAWNNSSLMPDPTEIRGEFTVAGGFARISSGEHSG